MATVFPADPILPYVPVWVEAMVQRKA